MKPDLDQTAGRWRRAHRPAVLSGDMAWRWPVCGGLALLLHVVVLSAPFHRPAVGDEAGQRHTEPAAVQTRRIVPAEPLPGATQPGETPLGVADPETGEADGTPEPAAERDVPVPETLQPGLLAPPATPAPPAGEGVAEYLDRSSLSQGPVAVSPVLLTYPEFPGDPGHHVAVLALLIDETGVVRRVTIEPPGLPEALESVARRAFLEARFQPGERGGQPVRSRIRVEVRFDSGPLQ